MSVGIDYGMGRMNIDLSTGIRYGVISRNAVPSWDDASELISETPHCPYCGNELVDYDGDEHEEFDSEGWDDYACNGCRIVFGSDNDGIWPEFPTYGIDQDGILAHCDSDGDIWIEKSPWVTIAAFCSPCAPGACHLAHPTPMGELAYCLPVDMFNDALLNANEDDSLLCQYPIWRIGEDGGFTLEYMPYWFTASERTDYVFAPVWSD